MTFSIWNLSSSLKKRKFELLGRSIPLSKIIKKMVLCHKKIYSWISAYFVEFFNFLNFRHWYFLFNLNEPSSPLTPLLSLSCLNFLISLGTLTFEICWAALHLSNQYSTTAQLIFLISVYLALTCWVHMEKNHNFADWSH